MKTTSKNNYIICLSFALILSFFYIVLPAISAKATEKNNYGLSNPKKDSDGVVTWDCVYFGNYWQNDTDRNGITDNRDAKQPIKWRVLSVDGDDAFLLADQILDYHEYNDTFTTNTGGTWETSALRQWLNDYFYQNAFDSVEQDLIQTTNVINENNPYWGTNGGNNTTDKIFLLSLSEVRNTTYGFHPTYDIASQTRTAIDTNYAKYRGAYMGCWWLRTIGSSSLGAAWVYSDNSSLGIAGTDKQAWYELGVRPALHLNLKASTNALSPQWCKAGTVSSLGAEVIQPTTYPIGNPASLKNPRTDCNGVTTWDCIYFGNYWQNDTNGDGTADKQDEKQPIKWRVLSVNGNDAFLLADQNLDCMSYLYSPSLSPNATWETCNLRGWLNGDFYWNAFDSSEQKAIQTTTIGNENNPTHGTRGGNNTSDKIYLLSITEATNSAYGFHHVYDLESKTRAAQNTEYAKKLITYVNNKPIINGDSWLLRTLGIDSTYTSYVSNNGFIIDIGIHSPEQMSIRPALHLDLTASTTASSSKWGWAGTVSAPGADIEEKTENLSSDKKTQKKKKTKTTAVTIRYAKNKKGRKLILSWKKNNEATGYQIEYTSNKRFQNSRKKLTKKTTYTLKKLKKKKTYYIRIRAYKLNGKKKIYGKWSKVKKIKIKK